MIQTPLSDALSEHIQNAHNYWVCSKDFDKPLYVVPTEQCRKIELQLNECVQERDKALAYAKLIATSLWQKDCKSDSPDWKPLDHINGVLEQIDSMLAGMERKK